MTESETKFELPGKIEHFLAALSKVYPNEGKPQLQELIVNAGIRVHEEWTYDNWDGGTYGHALYLCVPESIYIKVIRSADEICQTIRDDINKICKVRNEHIAEVYLEVVPTEDLDWRKESGLLISRTRNVPDVCQQRIWGENGYRVFISHKSEDKKETATLKGKLSEFGISAFVAHQDIHPITEWQDEIENALNSMNAFVALLTKDFHDSNWTDQEVGFALGKGVPIIAVRLGRDPYGFIGKFQALTCKWDQAPMEIAKLLIQEDQCIDAFVTAVVNCMSFNVGNEQAQLLPYIKHLNEEQADRLCDAFNSNKELNRSYGFRGNFPSVYGVGLADHLSRIMGKGFQRKKNVIQRVET